MTVIVAARFSNRMLLGADTYCTLEDETDAVPGSKLMTFGTRRNWRIACAGDVGETQRVFRTLARIAKPNIDMIGECVASMGCNESWYYVTDNKQIWRLWGAGGGTVPIMRSFEATGSGGEMVRGYVAAKCGVSRVGVWDAKQMASVKETIEQAVLATSMYHHSVGPELEWC